MIKFIAITIFFCHFSIFSIASDFTENGAKTLFSQAENIIKTKDKKAIDAFFKHYMASDAIIYKKSMLVSPDDLETPRSVEDVTYSREKYIELMQTISNIGVSYDIKYTVESFQPLPDNYMAYAAVNIVETSTLDKRFSIGNNNTVISSNCNYTMIDGMDSMKIAAANCIEKIILSE